MAQGNGQPSLVQFGRNVTPNHHALAERFVLLDNFYAAGDQSALGHQWCDEAYANDYVHKYGNARNDFAGSNPMAYAPTGFLWDHVRNHGMTVRMYGEFAATNMTPGSSTWTDVYNSWKNATGSVSVQSSTRVAGVRDILAPRYAGFEMRVADQSRAAPMTSLFAAAPDLSVYTALPNQIPLDEMNPPIAGFRGLERRLALASMRMDLSRPDAAPEDLLNRAIWHSVKGYKTPYPGRGEDEERRPGR